jgi:hypothetical protein
VDDAGLMLKYGVTRPQLRALLKKLVQMGALSKPEIDSRVPLKREAEAPVAKELPEIHATQLFQPESLEALQGAKVEAPAVRLLSPNPTLNVRQSLSL